MTQIKSMRVSNAFVIRLKIIRKKNGKGIQGILAHSQGDKFHEILKPSPRMLEIMGDRETRFYLAQIAAGILVFIKATPGFRGPQNPEYEDNSDVLARDNPRCQGIFRRVKS
jgi:hypothetical protein